MPSNKTKTKRSRKSSKKAKSAPVEEVAAVEEVVVEEVAAAAPVEETPVEETPVEDTPVEETPAEENADGEAATENNSVAVEETDTVAVRLGNLAEQVQTLATLSRTVQREMKLVSRMVTKLQKNYEKAQQKGRKRSGKKRANHNSGIMKAHPVSKKLNTFMSHAYSLQDPPQEPKEEYSRVDVLKAISSYVKTMELQDKTPGQGKYINLDKHLKKIFPELKSKKGDERLRYTLIMKHIGAHFPQKASAATSS